ncbi:hypothetical protein PPGU19_102370 (plasmid) [Paraburkholderia sp. PGU19]|nr:hypothetical protein PPGU19_102370 [Paraburkholderia sp. PGU19]
MLCYMGHVLTDNRHGLVANAQVTLATGTAERDAAEQMLADDFAFANAFCATHDDAGSCGRRRTAEMEAGSSTVANPTLIVSADLAAWRPPIEPRLNALVLMDPLAVMFTAPGFLAIRIQVLLYRPERRLHSARHAMR